MSIAAYIAAILLFAFAGFGADVGDLSDLHLIAFGLAALALGHVLPNGLSLPRR